MKKLIIALVTAVVLFFSIGQSSALAECTLTTRSGGGSNAVVDSATLHSGCVLVSHDGNLLTRFFTYNCCGQSVWVRVNAQDWVNLRSQGKLNGLRYATFSSSDSSVQSPLSFKKTVTNGFEVIDPVNFFD